MKHCGTMIAAMQLDETAHALAALGRRRPSGVPLLAALVVMACAPVSLLASPLRVDQLIRSTLQLDADLTRGAALYTEQCASCHGEAAHGSAANVVPALAGQRRAYLIKQLADFTELERYGPDMHKTLARAGLAEPQVWADISQFLNELPVAAEVETGSGKGVRLGEAIFRQQCAVCHEEDARGDEDGYTPSLRNQHYSYLLQQMRGLGVSHRLNVDADLARFIDSLDTDEMTAVADYLSRLEGPTRDRLKLRDDGTVSD